MFPQAIRPKSLLGTTGLNPGASIHSEARLEQGVIVDPGVVIGPRAEIGFGTIIGANSVIGSDVRIGRDCLIGPQVTISHALIGDNVIVHPGARIGQSSIDCRHAGIAFAPPGLPKALKIGRVIIQNGVEVGANATIDRGAAGDTVIGEETPKSAISRGSRKMPRLDAIASSPRKLAFPPAHDSKILPALELDLKIADRFSKPACSNSLN